MSLYDALLTQWVAQRLPTSHVLTRERWNVIEPFLRAGLHVLELGAGLSTWLFEASGVHLTTLEHDPRWAQRLAIARTTFEWPLPLGSPRPASTGTASSADPQSPAGPAHGASVRESSGGSVRLVVSPLEGSPPWYCWRPNARYDLVLIDGPPGTIGRAGFLAALPWFRPIPTRIILDDTHRRAERALATYLARHLRLPLHPHPTGLTRLG